MVFSSPHRECFTQEFGINSADVLFCYLSPISTVVPVKDVLPVRIDYSVGELLMPASLPHSRDAGEVPLGIAL